jgi:hypothetical protein
VDGKRVKRLAATIHHTLPEEANDVLDAPFTLYELHRAVKKGRHNKAPGADGMSQDVFKDAWEIKHPDFLAILQQMHTEGVITIKQKHGMMVCLPKIQRPTGPGDYRLLTLFNADIKVMGRIIANRLGLWLPSIIHTSQHCGVRGNTIFGAVATVREAIPQAEHTKQALCILSRLSGNFRHFSTKPICTYWNGTNSARVFSGGSEICMRTPLRPFTSMDTLRAPFR